MTRLFVVSLALCVVMAGAPASAEPRPLSVQRSGSCSGPTHWKLILRKGDPGKLIVAFSAWGGKANQKWFIFMEDNTNGFFSTTRTSGTGGKFHVRKVTKDLAGTDKIVVAANTAKGQTCQARASI